MNLATTKRLSSLAFAGLLCTVAMGCGPGAEGEPEPAFEELATEHVNPEGQVSASSVSCISGWHPHYATWPSVALYYPGQCSDKAATINSGWWVCMRSAPAVSCGGQGYSDVYPAGNSSYYYWARTEAFDGH